jgi:hypothetical protein
VQQGSRAAAANRRFFLPFSLFHILSSSLHWIQISNAPSFHVTLKARQEAGMSLLQPVNLEYSNSNGRIRDAHDLEQQQQQHSRFYAAE